MIAEPILFTFAAILFVLMLWVAVRSRIESRDIKKQLDEYDFDEKDIY